MIIIKNDYLIFSPCFNKVEWELFTHYKPIGFTIARFLLNIVVNRKNFVNAYL